MKRILAFMVDFFIIQMIASSAGVGFYMLVIRSNQEKMTAAGEIIFPLLIVGITIWLYFFISDYFCDGGGIGKKAMGIKLVSEGKRLPLSVSLKHSAAKMAVCTVYPAMVIYYLLKRQLPYDKWLKLEVVDR